ncbi:hypothetical protein HUU61_06665 [Rhodopseudomonas palustris]|nr:hypothetical protein [Rhodopseudomonas palustris]
MRIGIGAAIIAAALGVMSPVAAQVPMPTAASATRAGVSMPTEFSSRHRARHAHRELRRSAHRHHARGPRPGYYAPRYYARPHDYRPHGMAPFFPFGFGGYGFQPSW